MADKVKKSDGKVEGKKHREKEIPKKKLKSIEELIRLINESNSIILASIKNLPASQFQLIKKKLRGEAEIKVVRKSVIIRAIDSIERGVIKNFKKYLKEDIAIIFSKLNPFELSSVLSKNKSMARAKIGQTVDEDVVVEAGPTELVPGPVISELGSLGIKFAIEDGKIAIRERKVVLKAGQKVNEQAASIFSKFDMKPISVGLEPVVAYDSKEDKIYEDIKVDSEEAVGEIRTASRKALAFAVKIVYVCKETISLLLSKASREEKVLEERVNKEVGLSQSEIKDAQSEVKDAQKENKSEQEEK